MTTLLTFAESFPLADPLLGAGILQRAFPPEGALEAALVVGGGGAAGLAAHWIFFRVLRHRAAREEGEVEEAVVRRVRRPALLLLPLAGIALTLPVAFPGAVALLRLAALLGVLAGAWAVMGVLLAAQDVLEKRFRLDVADNLQARRIHTQFDLVRKIAVVVVVVVAAALVLMSVEAFRPVGAGLLASAGIAGLVLGFAAQRTLGNLLAGFQIALTQPIRIDDVVVVEGEWGRIEEITLTYVVVRIWDLRRLVLPIGYFIERPFQNWTRTSAEVLGTVFLHVDYSVPVDAVRAELRRILEGSPHWDGNVCVVHVTEAGERTVQLRALMSAGDSGTAWELRCEVREKLLEFLRREFPDGLPRLRAEIERVPKPGEPGGV